MKKWTQQGISNTGEGLRAPRSKATCKWVQGVHLGVLCIHEWQGDGNQRRTFVTALMNLRHPQRQEDACCGEVNISCTAESSSLRVLHRLITSTYTLLVTRKADVIVPRLQQDYCPCQHDSKQWLILWRTNNTQTDELTFIRVLLNIRFSKWWLSIVPFFCI
jgi:hypothetical protein